MPQHILNFFFNICPAILRILRTLLERNINLKLDYYTYISYEIVIYIILCARVMNRDNI